MNSFSKLHPSVLIVYFVAVLSIGMFVDNPIIKLASLVGGILFNSLFTGAKEKKSDFLFYLPLLCLLAITNPLFSHNGATPLFFMNGNSVTVESIVYGWNIAVMIISVMLWFKAYCFVMTSDKFVYLFARIIPHMSLLLSMLLRYVPMMKRLAKRLNRTQKAMGLYTSESRFDRLRSEIRLSSVLISWSLENTVETGKSMKARGYGLKKHTNYFNFRFLKSDLVMLLICFIFWVVTLSGKVSGKLDFFYYPKITEIPTEIYSIVCYATYSCLSFLPFIIEVVEMIRWKYYRSKI